MLKTRTSGAIAEIVECALKRGDTTKALFVPIKVTATNGHRTLIRYVAFFIYRPSNYTLVGARVSERWLFRHEIDGYENKAYHDSCWRTDGVDSTLAEIYFAMCREIAPQLPPKEVDIEAVFWHHAEVLEIDKVKFERDWQKPIVVTWKS